LKNPFGKTSCESLILLFRVWCMPISAEKHAKGMAWSSLLFVFGVACFFISILILGFSAKIIGNPADSVLPDWALLILLAIFLLSFPMMIIGYLLYRDNVGHYNDNSR